MSNVSSNTAARTPVAATPFIMTSHGLTEIHQVVFNLDSDGNIWQRGWGGELIVVSKEAKPHPTAGMAVFGWGNDIYSVFNMRLYYTNQDGKIFERCFTQGRGWYDGALTGQFDAFPGAGLGVRGSDNASLTWLFYQDAGTREICSLFRNSIEAAFVKTSVRFPQGIECTSIAVDPKGNSGVYYQKPDGKITQTELTPPQEPFSSERPYPPGTAIAATKDTLFCVTESNQIEVNVYDSNNNKWQPPVVIDGVSVIPLAPLAANAHPPPRDGSYTKTLVTQGEEHTLTKIGYTDPDTVVITVVS